MSIYAIADLHLSFNNPKPMNIFGDNWENHEKKIKDNWLQVVKDNDTVLIPGDFSWETYIENTYKDFYYLNSLPGKKILLKGNHDYWWTTLTNIRNYLKENNFNSINILFNNCYEVENYLIAGTRGWDFYKNNDNKIIQREINRLEISLKAAREKNREKDIIVCMHYPPISKDYINNEYEQKIVHLMNQYNVKKCFYGHLHGISHEQAINELKNNIQFQLVSADYLNFNLFKV